MFNSLPTFKNQERLHALNVDSQLGLVSIFCLTINCCLVILRLSSLVGLSQLALLVWGVLADSSWACSRVDGHLPDQMELTGSGASAGMTCPVQLGLLLQQASPGLFAGSKGKSGMCKTPLRPSLPLHSIGQSKSQASPDARGGNTNSTSAERGRMCNLARGLSQECSRYDDCGRIMCQGLEAAGPFRGLTSPALADSITHRLALGVW